MEEEETEAGFNILNYSIWRILFISLVIFIVYKFAASYIYVDIDTYDLRASIFSHRFLSVPGAVYSSEYTQRPFINTISHFNNTIISQMFDNSTSNFAAGFFLENLDSNSQSEIFFNKKYYDRYEPLSKFEQYHSSLMWRYVLIKNESTNRGRIRIKTVQNE